MNTALAQLQEKQAALAEAQEKLREVSLIPMFSVFLGGSSPRFPISRMLPFCLFLPV